MVYVLTLRASHNSARLECYVYTGNSLIVTLQFILKLEAIADSSVELDAGVSCNGQGLSVGGKGVIRDWVMEKMVDLRRGHTEAFSMR